MEESTGAYFGIIIIMIAFIVIASGFILTFLRYQKKLLAKQRQMFDLEVSHKKDLLSSNIKSSEDERIRIAKDVHDELGSIFSTLSLSFDQLKNEHKLTENAIASQKQLIESGISSVRRISRSIVPFELELFGLQQTLENYFNTISSVSNIQIKYDHLCRLENLDNYTALAIYRILQELCSNTIKYAQASVINVTIKEKDKVLAVEYIDNGKGVDIAGDKLNKGIGLKNIESRVIYLNGSLSLLSKQNEGFTCKISLPISTQPL